MMLEDDVAVHDAGAMRGVERRTDTGADLEDLSDGTGTADRSPAFVPSTSSITMKATPSASSASWGGHVGVIQSRSEPGLMEEAVSGAVVPEELFRAPSPRQ
jgi:hypothetical protein